MSNLSKFKRDIFLDKLNLIRENYSDDDEMRKVLNMIEAELTLKKFGLVWEEHEERVDIEMKSQIPVFSEDKTKEILLSDKDEFNFILEGDNLHSLKLLEKTHKGRINAIIIDPPYNTKNKDFVYNDTKIGDDDAFRHSKWLSFMEKRLSIAKKLLATNGFIMISIDDNEVAQLKLLCDEIFGFENFVVCAPTIMNLKGNQDEYGFAGTHEYTLVYAKNKSLARMNEFDVDEEEVENTWLMDEIGYYKQGATLKRTGADAPVSRRPNSFFPILCDENNNVSTITEEEHLKIFNPQTRELNVNYAYELKDQYENLGYTVILPITSGEETSWRWGREKVARESHEIIVNRGRGGISLYKKQRPQLGDLPTKKPKSILYKAEYSSGNGTEQLKEVFNEIKKFNNPKPLQLIKDLIHLSCGEDAIILDFFAGSGTTGHAVLELNKDGGNRRFILCTNNEVSDEKACKYFSLTQAQLKKFKQTEEYRQRIKEEEYQALGICQEVTYERLNRVIHGYKNSKGKEVTGIAANLKYYKTDYISKQLEDELIHDSLLDHIKEMIQLENHIKIDNEAYIVLLTDEDAEKFIPEITDKCKKIYREGSVLLDSETELKLRKLGVEIIKIPEYYFAKELREAGEL